MPCIGGFASRFSTAKTGRRTLILVATGQKRLVVDGDSQVEPRAQQTATKGESGGELPGRARSAQPFAGGLPVQKFLDGIKVDSYNANRNRGRGADRLSSFLERDRAAVWATFLLVRHDCRDVLIAYLGKLFIFCPSGAATWQRGIARGSFCALTMNSLFETACNASE